MKILECSDLDISGVEAAIPQGRRYDPARRLYSAEVKKLAPGEYYRAKLDPSNRLLFTFQRRNGEAYAHTPS